MPPVSYTAGRSRRTSSQGDHSSHERNKSGNSEREVSVQKSNRGRPKTNNSGDSNQYVIDLSCNNIKPSTSSKFKFFKLAFTILDIKLIFNKIDTPAPIQLPRIDYSSNQMREPNNMNEKRAIDRATNIEPIAVNNPDGDGDGDNNLIKSYSIDQMMNFAKDNKYPKRNIQFSDKVHRFTSILHFFKHIDVNKIMILKINNTFNK